MNKPDLEHETALARIAGQIAAGIIRDVDVNRPENRLAVAQVSVIIAKLIVEEIRRTE